MSDYIQHVDDKIPGADSDVFENQLNSFANIVILHFGKHFVS